MASSSHSAQQQTIQTDMDPQTTTPNTLTSPYINPLLEVQHSKTKGRSVVPKADIQPGTVLIIDLPYALVPAPAAHNPPFHICCNDACHRTTSANHAVVTCDKGCAPELGWCSDRCCEIDQDRHGWECTWLRQHGVRVRQEKGEVEFELVWLILRILIRREREKMQTIPTPAKASHWDHRGWESVWDLQGSAEHFPQQSVGAWTDLVDTYLVGKIEGVHATIQECLGLICRIETNSFGLYPGVTGVYPVQSWQGRGEYYGSGLYPVAAMFNHACCPNVHHKLDDQNRRIFRANSTIRTGEECSISYFDLVEFRDSWTRREEIRSKWTFKCECQRCKDDQAADEEVPDFLAAMDRSDPEDDD